MKDETSKVFDSWSVQVDVGGQLIFVLTESTESTKNEDYYGNRYTIWRSFYRQYKEWMFQ